MSGSESSFELLPDPRTDSPRAAQQAQPQPSPAPAAAAAGAGQQLPQATSSMASAAEHFRPSLSARLVPTHVNVLVAGASGVGKSSLVRQLVAGLGHTSRAGLPGHEGAGAGAADAGGSADPAARFQAHPAAFTTSLPPLALPEACRELRYTFVEAPGHGEFLDPAAFLELLVTHVVRQQTKDLERLRLWGSQGMPRALVCGCLEHATTAGLYVCAPHGPTKLDRVAMAALSQHTTVVPVVGMADALSKAEAAAAAARLSQLAAATAGGAAGATAAQRPPAFVGAQGLLQLLGSDEVYALLDRAWELYSETCSSYAAAAAAKAAGGGPCTTPDAGVVAALLDAACAGARALLPGSVAADTQLAELRAALEEQAVKLGNAQAQIKQQAQELQKEQALLKELAGLYKSRNPYSSMGPFSAELKARMAQLR